MRKNSPRFAPRGYPATQDELDAWHPLPPAGENAADIYAQAFTRYASTPDENKLPVQGMGMLPERGEPLPIDMLAGVDNYLVANRAALDLLHQAATMPLCRFPGTPGAPSMSHLARARNGARLLKMEAIALAEHNQPAQAARSLEAGLTLGRSFHREPTLIANLVAIAIEAISLSGGEWQPDDMERRRPQTPGATADRGGDRPRHGTRLGRRALPRQPCLPVVRSVPGPQRIGLRRQPRRHGPVPLHSRERRGDALACQGSWTRTT